MDIDGPWMNSIGPFESNASLLFAMSAKRKQLVAAWYDYLVQALTKVPAPPLFCTFVRSHE